MSEKPIIMSAWSIRRILTGVKTQTRRVMRADVPADVVEFLAGEYWVGMGAGSHRLMEARPPYTRGDRLWVREALRRATRASGPSPYAIYTYDGTPAQPMWAWARLALPARYMPKSCARLWLTCTDVEAKRLWHMSPDDVEAEGAESGDEFVATWRTLHPKRGQWGDNPWVWVIKFRLGTFYPKTTMPRDDQLNQ